MAWFIFLLGRFKLIQYRPPQISMGSSPWSRKFNKENVKNSFSSSYGNTVVNGMNCHCDVCRFEPPQMKKSKVYGFKINIDCNGENV